jgi:ABC-type multidrug transport system fused ATPase/permease subunit
MGLRRLWGPARVLGEVVREVHKDLGEQILMTLQCMRTIRAYGQEQAHQLRFERASAVARSTAIKLTRLSSLLGPLTEVGYLAILCVVIAGSPFWDASFATTLACVALLYRLQPRTRELDGNLLYLAQIQPQLRSVRQMLETGDKTYPVFGDQPLDRMWSGIRFERVTFTYPGGATPSLRDATFDVPAGKVTAIVGASGAGKTTIVNLLLRLYRPQAGTIAVDGKPIETLSRTDWLGRLAVAGQDVDLIEGTVIDNIRMADAEASHEAVLAAARRAGVAEFVDTLPDGYDTWIGQQGTRFSGGQRQRIALARALLRGPQFLVLDEAMNAIDHDLENRIRGAITEFFQSRTILMISHRVETVISADHVICMKNGRIVESGRPSDLLNNSGSFLNKAIVREKD